jgi:hypothetical protein
MVKDALTGPAKAGESNETMTAAIAGISSSVSHLIEQR